jgi:hypothetical protein
LVSEPPVVAGFVESAKFWGHGQACAFVYSPTSIYWIGKFTEYSPARLFISLEAFVLSFA